MTDIIKILLEIKHFSQMLNERFENFKKCSTKFAQKSRLEIVEFHITEHCNLNCKSCVHFSPLAEEEYLPLDIFQSDIKRLKELTEGNINTINLFGGEPLLNRDVTEYLKIARDSFSKSTINLVTNGILLMEQDDFFWNTLKNYNITIAITEYPINIDYEKIFQKAEEQGVKTIFFASNKKNSQWHFPLDLDGKQNKYYNFAHCQEANQCTNIYHGKLFICPIASNIRHFNKFFDKNIPITKYDYIDIYKTKNIKNILRFISMPTPVCKYCNIKARTFDNQWEVSKKSITEWT